MNKCEKNKRKNKQQQQQKLNNDTVTITIRLSGFVPELFNEQKLSVVLPKPFMLFFKASASSAALKLSTGFKVPWYSA